MIDFIWFLDKIGCYHETYRETFDAKKFDV